MTDPTTTCCRCHVTEVELDELNERGDHHHADQGDPDLPLLWGEAQ
jgi:hypothetical protein